MPDRLKNGHDSGGVDVANRGVANLGIGILPQGIFPLLPMFGVPPARLVRSDVGSRNLTEGLRSNCRRLCLSLRCRLGGFAVSQWVAAVTNRFVEPPGLRACAFDKGLVVPLGLVSQRYRSFAAGRA
jgi:hypothetical protein